MIDFLRPIVLAQFQMSRSPLSPLGCVSSSLHGIYRCNRYCLVWTCLTSVYRTSPKKYPDVSMHVLIHVYIYGIDVLSDFPKTPVTLLVYDVTLKRNVIRSSHQNRSQLNSRFQEYLFPTLFQLFPWNFNRVGMPSSFLHGMLIAKASSFFFKNLFLFSTIKSDWIILDQPGIHPWKLAWNHMEPKNWKGKSSSKPPLLGSKCSFSRVYSHPQINFFSGADSTRATVEPWIKVSDHRAKHEKSVDMRLAWEMDHLLNIY